MGCDGLKKINPLGLRYLWRTPRGSFYASLLVRLCGLESLDELCLHVPVGGVEETAGCSWSEYIADECFSDAMGLALAVVSADSEGFFDGLCVVDCGEVVVVHCFSLSRVCGGDCFPCLYPLIYGTLVKLSNVGL